MSLRRRIRALEEAAGPERCGNCREWQEWVVRYEDRGEPNPTPCPRCGFQQNVIVVCYTEEAGRL